MSRGSHPTGQTHLELRERQGLGKRTGCQGSPPPERTKTAGRQIHKV